MMRHFLLSWLTTFKVTVFSILLFAGFCIALRYQQRESIKMDSIFREQPDWDELDYHFIALNFAFNNQFPVIGYLSNPADYKIRYEKGMEFGVDNVYLDMFKTAGPVYTFVRPPVYPLLVGIMYKIFGYHLYVLIWFNILLVAATASMMPYVGFRIWDTSGFFSGLMASMLFMLISPFSCVIMNVELLSCFLFLIMFFTAIQIEKNGYLIKIFLLGVLIGLEFLTKAIIIFLPLLYIIYYYFNLGRPKLIIYLKKAGPLFAGMAVIILPWMGYINYQKSQTVKAREEWCAKIKASMELPLMFDNRAEIELSHQNKIHALKNFVKILYMGHSGQIDRTVTSTSQLGAEGLLYTNNEYCVGNTGEMGGLGWLWKMIRTSYYNTHHLSSSSLMKVIYFYLENKSYIYRIPAARLGDSADWGDYPPVFWLAPALWALAATSLMVRNQKNNWRKNAYLIILFLSFIVCCTLCYYANSIDSPLMRVMLFMPFYILWAFSMKNYNGLFSNVYTVFWLCIFLLIFLLYSDTRFTLTALGVNCLVISYAVYIITSQITGLRKSPAL
jgi:4-amino-4-deoxy-L-arabinose transferase-like glycosyltransferase